MLKEERRPDKQKVTFTYDALGRRLSKHFSCTTTHFLWSGNEMGRYISEDPIGFLSGEPNFFAYVSDTNAWVDLLGLQSLYRGGRNGKVSFKAREKDYETKVVDGKELVQPTRGVSLSDKKENLEKMSMEAYEVDQIPETLQIVKTGRSHYEITPKKPMTVDEYQAELAKVTVKE